MQEVLVVISGRLQWFVPVPYRLMFTLLPPPRRRLCDQVCHSVCV